MLANGTIAHVTKWTNPHHFKALQVRKQAVLHTRAHYRSSEILAPGKCMRLWSIPARPSLYPPPPPPLHTPDDWRQIIGGPLSCTHGCPNECVCVGGGGGGDRTQLRGNTCHCQNARCHSVKTVGCTGGTVSTASMVGTYRNRVHALEDGRCRGRMTTLRLVTRVTHQ